MSGICTGMRGKYRYFLRENLAKENKTFVSYVAVFDENEEWIFIPLCK